MRRVLAAVLAAMWAVWAGVSLAGADRPVRVDREGVLRWADDNREVALLGVNTYTPFTIDHAEIKRLGVDHRQVIRDDVAHFRRLGFGCIRVHCFERQFSDTEGNLIDNEHLALLDDLIDVCRSNGIYTVLTPIAWWGGGSWTIHTQGFSDVYTMQQLTSDRTTWPIQARFLKQFAEHVNRFTGRRYADDPCVLAFECINEPLYPKDTPDSLVTAYIDTLVDGLRASGTTKPIYYNSWQGRNAATAASRVDGVTCNYYPTGLVAGHELAGPQLGRIRASSLHPDAAIALKSRMAYEFDAADVGASYMYPALAKLFRAEGVQVAAQFQYDALPLADVNRNWQTHHLNLIYTPGKALSMAIAAEVFTRVPRFTPFNVCNEEMAFPPFRVSVAEDLAEMITPEAYLHSNTTRTPPPDPAALERVWGCGSSPVIAYGGTGAYFFDRAAPGVWRLQIYPDVFTVADPFTGTPEVKVKVLPTRHPMTVRLPDLGEAFTVWAVKDPSMKTYATARNGVFEATPGDYFLTGAGHSEKGFTHEIRMKLAALAPSFRAPQPAEATIPLVRATLTPQWRAGVALDVNAEAALATNLIARFVSAEGRTHEITLKATAPERSIGRFEGTLAGAALTPGVWGVTFRATGPGGTIEIPAGPGADVNWLRVAGETSPLMRLPENPPAVIRNGIQTTDTAIVMDDVVARAAIRLAVSDYGEASAAAGYTLPFTSRELSATSGNRWGLRIVARGGATGARVEIGFRMKNGQGLGCNLRIGPDWCESVVPAAELAPLWGLPSREAFHWSEVERISVLTGAWLFREGGPEGGQTFDLAALEWVPLAPALRLDAVAEGAAWSLFDPQAWLRVPLWHAPLQRWTLTDDRGRTAVHLAAERFDGEHESLSLRAPCDGKTFARLWETEGADATLVIRVRATQPKTTAFELALVEDSGVAWGMNVPLTGEWQTLRIPTTKLRLFTQWDKTMASKADSHLRLSRLSAVSVCFGKWLFPQAASEPHAFEIAALGIECLAR